MSAFHDQFEPDPEMEDVSPGKHRIWTTSKPIFQKAVVTYAPPYPSYTAKTKSRETLEVKMSDNGKGFGDHQKSAWDFLIDNAVAVEASLRCKLFAQHKKSQQQFLQEILPEFRKIRNSWKKIEDKLDWRDPSAIDYLFELIDVELIDDGIDECGYCCFNFESGWDLDHGIGILMHKSNVLAAAGRSELSCGGYSIEAVKHIQSYDLDEGDLSLLET